MAPSSVWTRVPGATAAVMIVDLHLGLQFRRRHFGDQPGTQLLRHGVHVRDDQASSPAICLFERFSPMK